MNEGNVLFKNALNTFYLWLYGIGYMAKELRLQENKPAATIIWAALSVLLYAQSHRQPFATPVMDCWLE